MCNAKHAHLCEGGHLQPLCQQALQGLALVSLSILESKALEARLATASMILQVFSLERWLQWFYKLVAIDVNQNYMRSTEFSNQQMQDRQSASVHHQIRHLVTIKLINQV
jgi:hypothetical protein